MTGERTPNSRRKDSVLAALLTALALPALAGEAGAHGGGLDRYGGHTNYETGEYHCHREPCFSRGRTAARAASAESSISSEEAVGWVVGISVAALILWAVVANSRDPQRGGGEKGTSEQNRPSRSGPPGMSEEERATARKMQAHIEQLARELGLGRATVISLLEQCNGNRYILIEALQERYYERENPNEGKPGHETKEERLARHKRTADECGITMGYAAEMDVILNRKAKAAQAERGIGRVAEERKTAEKAGSVDENEEATVHRQRGPGRATGSGTTKSPAAEGGLQLVKRLGAGTFGVTWKGLDRGARNERCAGTEVAVKIYRPDPWTRETEDGRVELSSPSYREKYQEWLEKFVDEAEHLKGLRHRGIVRVDRYGRGFGSAYIVMEYIAGGTMREALRRAPKGFDFPVVRNAMMQLCMALGAVHDAGMIHRDVKPQNIMIRGGKELVLIDFGAARPVTRNADGMTAMYTERYAPIEQYDDNNDHQGPWTDLYAVAAVGHELLLGEAPRPAPARVNNPRLNELDQLEERVGRSRTIEAIRRGLAREATGRPATCAEMIRILNGQDQNGRGGSTTSTAKHGKHRTTAKQATALSKQIAWYEDELALSKGERRQLESEFPDPSARLKELHRLADAMR